MTMGAWVWVRHAAVGLVMPVRYVSLSRVMVAPSRGASCSRPIDTCVESPGHLI